MVTPDGLPPGDRRRRPSVSAPSYVNDACAEHGWAIRTLSVSRETPIPSALDVVDYTAHLGPVDTGWRWTAPGVVHPRSSSTAGPANGAPSHLRVQCLVCSAPTPGCLPYATTLSYVVTVRDAVTVPLQPHGHPGRRHLSGPLPRRRPATWSTPIQQGQPTLSAPLARRRGP